MRFRLETAAAARKCKSCKADIPKGSKCASDFVQVTVRVRGQATEVMKKRNFCPACAAEFGKNEISKYELEIARLRHIAMELGVPTMVATQGVPAETYRGDAYLIEQLENFLATGKYQDHTIFHEVIARLKGLAK
jgi:hypothetical protein